LNHLDGPNSSSIQTRKKVQITSSTLVKICFSSINFKTG
jgi:hypothetical protein